MPRWIVTCNFDELRIYDLKSVPLIELFNDDFYIEPIVFDLNRRDNNFSRLRFLVDPNDESVYPEIKISKQAGEIVGKIYRALERGWAGDLNKLCVRLVFCLYADDSGIFDQNSFRHYIKSAPDRRQALIDLFTVLNTPPNRRDKKLRAELKQFPYVNGGLFEEIIDIPPIKTDICHYLTEKNFSWRGISPTIFGAIFESTIGGESNRGVRRAGGMHYTSPANIRKVIDPLFLDDLHNEFRAICRLTLKKRRQALETFQDKIASLTFLDPACGSGNFLTETYIALRTLENEIFKALLSIPNYKMPCTIKVSIEQFHGIEINAFAVAVANTAMWISEHQMLRDTESILHEDIPALPLKHSARIVCANALKIDWATIAPNVDYIIGNPPFSGARMMSVDNKNDLFRVFEGWKNAGNLDFVSCWFKRAAQFMLDTKTRAALVATNSICQGETVGVLWSKLLEMCHIDFAYRTFKWTHDDDEPPETVNKRKKDSEAEKTAAVHCVIIGFSCAFNRKPKYIYDGDAVIEAANINGYLLDAPNYYVESRSRPLCDVPIMSMGNQPIDGGYYLFTPDEYEEFIDEEPRSKKYFRRWYGAEEFIKGKVRYCLWLGDATFEEIMSMPKAAARVEAVRQYRRLSKRTSTRKIADRPTHFQTENMPTGNFIVVPEVSGGNRKYIPMGFMPPDVLCSNKLMIVPNADLFHFGVLTSIVDMAWMRVVCGRHGTSYDYSTTIVYNNFPWCDRTVEIERTAQGILDVRSRYPDRTMAWLYDEATMPDDLRLAHLENDNAVLDAYGFERSLSELKIVSRLMSMYQRLLSSKGETS